MLLPLILALLVLVRERTFFVALEKEHLGDALVRVDAARGGVVFEISRVALPSHSASKPVTLMMMPQRA